MLGCLIIYFNLFGKFIYLIPIRNVTSRKFIMRCALFLTSCKSCLLVTHFTFGYLTKKCKYGFCAFIYTTIIFKQCKRRFFDNKLYVTFYQIVFNTEKYLFRPCYSGDFPTIHAIYITVSFYIMLKVS